MKTEGFHFLPGSIASPTIWWPIGIAIAHVGRWWLSTNWSSRVGTASGPNVVESQDSARLLREGMRKLDPARQELLVLKFSQGLSNAEIGEIMGRSEGAIKSLYHRTLLALRKELAKKGLHIQ